MSESIKGFFRRQSQKVGQTVGGQERTEDVTLKEQQQNFEAMKKINDNLGIAISVFVKNLSAVASSLMDVRRAVSDVPAFAEDIQLLDVAHYEIVAKIVNIDKALKERSEVPFSKVREAYNGIAVALADRDAKKLEYDFFRNKVRELKANPPKEADRLPRNEAILAKWQTDFEAADQQAKELLSMTLARGLAVQRSAMTSFLVAFHTFAAETSATTRVGFPTHHAVPQSPEEALTSQEGSSPMAAASPPASPAERVPQLLSEVQRLKEVILQRNDEISALQTAHAAELAQLQRDNAAAVEGLRSDITERDETMRTIKGNHQAVIKNLEAQMAATLAGSKKMQQLTAEVEQNVAGSKLQQLKVEFEALKNILAERNLEIDRLRKLSPFEGIPEGRGDKEALETHVAAQLEQ